MSNKKHLTDEPKYNTEQQTHIDTRQSHKYQLRQISQSKTKSEDVIDVKRENECLKRELSSSKKQLRRLKRRMSMLEGYKRKKVKESTSYLQVVLESRSGFQSEIDLDKDDDFVKSWEVLGHHFSEVIRRHHEVLAEKDRQIRELQEKQYPRELSNRLLNCSMEDLKCKMPSEDLVQEKRRAPLEREETLMKLNMGLQSTSDQSAYQCDCTKMSVYKEDCLMHSGENLSEHFSEVIRRHRQELGDKDQLIQELEQALKLCINRKPPKKRVDDSEVQMWYHDYNYHSQPSIGGHQATKRVSSPRPTIEACDSLQIYNKHSPRAYSDETETPKTSDEEDDKSTSSSDTFVAIEKCQRLESIVNLERLRQNLIERLELEEKLDQLYWQTELGRFRALREEQGDSFDPERSFNKDFEMFETTRLELLNALNDVKVSAKREPEIFVKPHSPIQVSESTVKPQFNFLESESKPRVSFKEEITITTVQTMYGRP